jgi:hypothetical protein
MLHDIKSYHELLPVYFIATLVWLLHISLRCGTIFVNYMLFTVLYTTNKGDVLCSLLYLLTYLSIWIDLLFNKTGDVWRLFIWFVIVVKHVFLYT